MSVYPHNNPPQAQVGRFPVLTSMGYDVRAYEYTVGLPEIITSDGRYLLIIRGTSTVLFSSENKAEVDWIDFGIELVVGLTALITGFKMGREAYEVFRPMVDELHGSDERFRELLNEIGKHALAKDPLASGKAARDLWAYLWSHHRKALWQAIVKSVKRSLTGRRLFFLLVRWMIRLWSAGAALLIEIGMLVIPLNRKLRQPN